MTDGRQQLLEDAFRIKQLQLENEQLRKDLALERQERMGLYPVIDDMRRVRELLEKEVTRLDNQLKEANDEIERWRESHAYHG